MLPSSSSSDLPGLTLDEPGVPGLLPDGSDRVGDGTASGVPSSASATSTTHTSPRTVKGMQAGNPLPGKLPGNPPLPVGDVEQAVPSLLKTTDDNLQQRMSDWQHDLDVSRAASMTCDEEEIDQSNLISE